MTTRREFLAALAAAQTRPVTVYRNGRILTMDARNRTVDTIAIRDGKIVSVGGPPPAGARMVDLKGRVMLPGFYAAHDHLPQNGVAALFSVNLNSPPMGPIESIDELVRALQAKARTTPKGEWVVGRGYDDTLMRDHRHPNRHDLDKVSTDHPIWVIHTSGHLGVANSRALQIAKVTKDTPAPRSGVIRREANGEPDGVFEELGSLVSQHIPNQTKEQRQQAIAYDDKFYLSKGVTTTVIAGNNPERVGDLREAISANRFHLRAICLLSGGIPDTLEKAAALGDDRVRVTGVKLWEDGSLQGLTGHLTAPYYKTPPGKDDYRGYSNRTQAQLNDWVLKHHRGGYQVAIHANGDAAIDEVLIAYREAQRQFPRRDTRHRIEHCQTPRMDQLDTMRELGISPSFFVGHVYYWGDRHRDIFLGPQRAAHISPLASALKRGLHFTIHNDTPVTTVDPLLLVWCSVNRLTRENKVLGPDERIGVEPALRAVTSGAAWQNHEESACGSVEPGKRADFVVLEKSPFDVDPKTIKDIAILETIAGGESVYKR